MPPVTKSNPAVNLFKVRLIGLFIAISLCLTYFYQIRPWAMGIPGNSTNLWVFTADASLNKHVSSLYPPWRPRIGCLWIAGRLVDGIMKNGLINPQDYQSNNIIVLNVTSQQNQQVSGNYFYTEDYRNCFGLYHAAWLFLLFLILLFMVEDPVFVMFGCFAGLFYMLTPRAFYYSYPWDIPSMVFFTLSYLLWLRQRYAWMLGVIFIGTLFKETVAVTAFLFFFTNLNWRKRLLYFGAAAVSTFLLKIAVTMAVDGKIEIFTADVTSDGASGKFLTLVNSLHELFTPNVNHFIFLNAGTFLVALFLPMRTQIQKGTKAILLIFFAGQMLAGVMSEFRIMLEVLPVSILYLRRTLTDWTNPQPVPAVAQGKSANQGRK